MAKKTKKVSYSRLNALILQSAMIVFSVLLALFLNDIRDQQKIKANLEVAYLHIRSEVENNRLALTTAIPYHRQCLGAIDSVLRLNDRRRAITPFSQALSQCFPNGLKAAKLQDDAWQAFMLTGQMSQLRYDEVFSLTKLYRTQETGVEATQQSLETFIRQPERFQPGAGLADLESLRLMMQELCAQEKLLLTQTEKTLFDINNWRHLEP